ncbi:sensor histidine kinase [Phytohabitans rumicis]|uniref:histidine kinase n=1 Tax=Phytohabitans rumicis TaxID=1076125 RepID=A0A6V8KWH3_9ACTN|nr:histidine kinase [Phytohabitans rumicis]GFJ89432.1 two-component sensor histidine kinase [Phytohabitans rumicis]
MRRLATDFALWVVLGAPVAVSWPGHNAYPLALLVASLAALGAAIALSRAHPLVSLFVVVALTAADGNYSFALPVVSYLVGRRMASVRPAAIGFVVIVVVGSPFVLLRTGFITWASMAGVLLYAGLFPWLVGRYRRQQQDLVAAGWEHAEQLEREQRMLADQVRLRERTRIAEDMHDSLGHELSLIALRAGALELAPDLDERHRIAATELRASAGAATDRLREIIGVLRDGTDPAPTQPVDDTIAELVRRAKDSGMAVALDTEGDLKPLPPMVDRAAYRVVQEALTNATKHAPGAAVAVRLRHGDTEATVTVRNAPPPAGPLPARSQGRRGLVGLRERVRLAGGTLSAARLPEGGFEVVARLPYAAGPVASPDSPSTERRRIVQRQARRGLITAIAVPAALGAALGATAIGYYVYATTGSVLTPREYATLSVGTDRAAAERVLPRRQMLDPPSRAEPPGSDCHYYRSHGDILRAADAYRLCFAGDRLVAKDVIPIRRS